jgi:hypothetical protein
VNYLSFFENFNSEFIKNCKFKKISFIFLRHTLNDILSLYFCLLSVNIHVFSSGVNCETPKITVIRSTQNKSHDTCCTHVFFLFSKTFLSQSVFFFFLTEKFESFLALFFRIFSFFLQMSVCLLALWRMFLCVCHQPNSFNFCCFVT